VDEKAGPVAQMISPDGGIKSMASFLFFTVRRKPHFSSAVIFDAR
jgi:hypothetical protein